MFFLQIIEFLIFIYFAFASIYILLFSFAGFFSYHPKKLNSNRKRKIAVLIPGYKEDDVILNVAKDALLQNYPTDFFEIIIIADSFKKETIKALKKISISLVEVSFEKSTKSKALNKAMEIIGDDYEIALVLDADNLMEKEFLNKINSAFESGFHIVQAHRVAKNLNTNFAILDAISEEINNNIFRNGHRNMGLSSALIGSGMAFSYGFFKEKMKNIKAVGGFDKELELSLLRENYKIEYLPNAIVYDEKVQKSEAFSKQRRRWISVQFIYFKKYFLSGLKHLFLKGNVDFFDKVFQMIQPPRILLIGILFIISLFFKILSFFDKKNFDENLFLGTEKWTMIFIFTVIAFLFSIPKKFYNFNTFIALLSLPKAFILMLLSLLKLKGANKKFIHTKHGITKK